MNPPEDNGATIGQSVANTDFGGFGGDGSRYTTNSYDNVNLKSEESEYYNVGFIIQRGAFSTSVDYFHNELQEGTRTLTTDAILRALVVGSPSANAPINCASPLLNVDPDLTDAQGNTHSVAELNGPCVQGQSLLNSPVGGGGLTGGALHSSAISAKPTVARWAERHRLQHQLQLRPVRRHAAALDGPDVLPDVRVPGLRALRRHGRTRLRRYRVHEYGAGQTAAGSARSIAAVSGSTTTAVRTR